MALQHDLPLISTIATGLTLSFAFGLIAHRLRISPIVGYLLAGVIIGPYTPGYIGNISIAEELSEIGIVLLMFGVGLHFSVKDLLEVRRIALPGALVQIATATILGAGIAHCMWSWPLEGALMFGLALSVASTVVLLRSLEEHNILQSMNGRIAIGWLVVEDLVMILALVLVPALSHAGLESSNGTALSQVFVAIGKVCLFIMVMMVGGKRFLPWLLTLVVKTRSRELFTLAVFATAVGVAFGAAKLFGVSLALGAFFGGMMIRESDLNHEVADRSLPFQDAFAVLFFVSVGMLFNPQVIISHPLDVLATVAIIIVGKSLAAMLIILMFGYPLKTGILVSAGLAQIGEFSFVLIGLGLNYDLLPPEGRDLVLSGAIISIAVNPIIFKLSRLSYELASKHERFSNMFNVRDNDLSHLRRDEKNSLKDIVILVGHGRVGKHISRNMRAAHIDLVIVDSNRERIDALRDNGFASIAGDATYPDTLREAGIEKAVAIAIAIPDPFEARRIFETARALNPKIRVLVRAHNMEEVDYFQQQNVDLAITGPRAIAHRMVEFLTEQTPPKHTEST